MVERGAQRQERIGLSTGGVGWCGSVGRALPARLSPARDQAAALTALQPLAGYGALQQWCERTGAGLGRPELPPQEVLRALVQRMLVDPELAADLVADLRDSSTTEEVAAYVGW